MYFIKIGAVTMPTPCEYSISYKDIDSSDSGRSDETGIMHRNRIRRGVVTCEAKWRLNGTNTVNLGNGLLGQVLSVSLLDPADGSYKSCDMYVDSYKCDFYQQQEQSEQSSYWEIECRLIEY